MNTFLPGRPVAQPADGRRGRLALGAVAVLGGLLAGAAASVAPSAGSPSAEMVLVVFAVLGLLCLAIVTDVQRVGLALILLDLPFQWDVNVAYRLDIAQKAGLGGFNFSLTTLALLVLYGVWLARLLVDREGAAAPRLRCAAIPAAFLGVLVVSMVVATNRVVAGFEVTLIAQMLALFVYVASNVRSRRDVRFVAIMLLWGLALNATVSLVSYAVPGGVRVPGTAVQHATVGDPIGTRLAGPFGAPNAAGAYLAFMLTLAISLCLSPVGGRIRRLALVAATPAAVALTLTLSRGAWIAFVVSVLVVLLGVRGQRATRISPRALIGIAVALMVVIVPLHSEISARLGNDDKGAAASRVPLMRLAGHMIGDHPLLGVGANNFAVVLPDYAGPAFSADWLAVVHNKYLLIWAESGLVALALFLVFMGSTIARGWRARRSDDALTAAVALGLAAAVAGHLVHMCFDTFQSRPMTQTLWFAAAVLASAALATTAGGAGRPGR
jgi:O-antigen ligase